MKGLAAALAVAVLCVACGGGGGSFPEETECPPPAPLATARSSPGTVAPDAYVRRIQGSTLNLERLRSDLRKEYADDTFYRRAEFRPDFAQYASMTVCTAESMLQTPAPAEEYAEYKASLDTALTDLIEHTRFGREAVRSRNVSEYRDWFKDADRKIAAVRTAANAIP